MARVQPFAAGKLNGAARAALRSRAEDLLEDLEELREDAAKLAVAAGQAARAEVRATGARVNHLRDEVEDAVRRKAKSGVRYVNENVQSRPAAMIGIAAGVGFLLGLVFSKR